MVRQHSSTGGLEVAGIVALTLGLGIFVLGGSALAVVLLGLLSASLVSLGRARARGWSAERLGITATFLVGAILLAIVGWVAGHIVGTLVVGFGVWLAWHLGVGQRVREL